MPITAEVIHGYAGDENESWLPRLRAELGKIGGIDTPAITLPSSTRPNLQDQLEALRSTRDSSSARILICHSLGVLLGLHDLLKDIESGDKNIIGAVHIAGSFKVIPRLRQAIGRRIDPAFLFAKPEEQLQQLSAHCPHTVYHGTDDDYVPPSYGMELGNIIGAEVQWIQDGGHLNAATIQQQPGRIDELIASVVEDVRSIAKQQN